MKKQMKLYLGAAVLIGTLATFMALVSPTAFAQIVESIRDKVGSVLDLDGRAASDAVADAPATGLSSFHFLPPLAPATGDPTRFDPSLLNQLSVEVCEVTASGCTLVKTFTSQSPNSERLKIESNNRDGSYYIAAWDTSRVSLNNKTYRVKVLLPLLQLGSIDLTRNVYTRFGRTWPIKFRVDKDPALRVRQLRSLRRSASQIASVLKNEFGLGREQIAALLAGDVEPFSEDDIAVALDGVFQNVIVPFTTKVSDETTRDALTSYDRGTGTMSFMTETPVLRNLNIGDVLVSEPSAAAPFGYLRKVTAIRRSGSGYTVETVQAKINEAISQGTLKAAGKLLPTDIASSSAARPNPVDGPEAPAIDIGDGFNFQRNIDVTIDLAAGGGDVNGTGTVRVQGSIFFNAGYNLGIGVETCAEVPPVCVDRVEARVNVDQKSYIKVTGQFNGTLNKEETIDTIQFEPITFFIGPIPVVIVPTIDVIVGVDGEAHANFRFEAEATSTLALGAKWTDPDDGGQGWQNINQFNPLGGRIIDSGLNANLRVEGYGKANAKLLLYDVAGPGVGGRVGLRADVRLGQKPLWTIDGHLVGDVNFSFDIGGVIDLGNYSRRVLDESFRIGEAPNQPPVCSSSTATISANIGVPKTLGPGTGFDGFFQCTDPEGESISYSAASNLDGVIATNVGFIRYAFPTAGVRTVNITAKDASNATTSFSVTVDVRNALPIVNIMTTTNTIPATVQYFLTATAYDPESGSQDPNLGFLTCDRISFQVSSPDTVTRTGSGGTCGAVVIFRQVGTRTVTVSATDPNGGVGTSSLTVNVTAEPANHPPVINTQFFAVYAYRGPFSIVCPDPNYYCLAPDNALLYNGQAGSGDYFPPLLLDIGSVTDADGDPISVQWHCRTGTQEATIGYDQVYQLPTCNPLYSPFDPIRVYAVVSDGVNSVESPLRTYRMLQRIN